ncbi:MAG: hypothetical protein ACRD29_17265 [Acidimicrobiales bacterium]
MTNFESENATWRAVGSGGSYIVAALKTLLETGEPLVLEQSA